MENLGFIMEPGLTGNIQSLLFWESEAVRGTCYFQFNPGHTVCPCPWYVTCIVLEAGQRPFASVVPAVCPFKALRKQQNRPPGLTFYPVVALGTVVAGWVWEWCAWRATPYYLVL